MEMGRCKRQVCIGASCGRLVFRIACFVGSGWYFCSVGVYFSPLKHLVHSSHSVHKETDSLTHVAVRH